MKDDLQNRVCMMKRHLSGITLECIQGDITAQSDIIAVVNAANAWLKRGGGVAGAIHRAAGPELEKACRPLAPIEPGQAVITQGYHLPNPYVIHCLGPIYGRDHPEAERLASCYRNALFRCEENNIASVAFPSIATGAFGYPVKAAAAVAADAIVGVAPTLKSLRLIRFVLFSRLDSEIYGKAFSEEK